ncbi:DUF4160 domain-containing protein [Paenibacillus sp. F411]|uniref:DUF4160 domain-containing protein n=1 Tax=Paenibacillus sp. F411 TaxID=2820239 RepID=UPI001AAEE181|nr:DUF4160 domain-containing protein [Paenibacillus sp. F411]MBO2942524.1 DUF4160 domain-containing protein [Paenibacillus sp. F411]
MLSWIKRLFNKKVNDGLEDELKTLLHDIMQTDIRISQHNATGMSMLVATYKDLRFIIRTDESGSHMHTPHFHVESGGRAASYRLKDCSNLAGRFPQHIETLIREFWYKRRRKLWKRWRSSRPTNIYCTI